MKAAEFQNRLGSLKQQLVNHITSLARCFETYEVAAELDTPVKVDDGYDEQDEPYLIHQLELDGTMIVEYHGNETNRLKPEDCEIQLLIDVLCEMERTLEKLKVENA